MEVSSFELLEKLFYYRFVENKRRKEHLSPKIRSKMSILLSRVSLDDYQLKVRNLLRNSEFRDTITQLPKGKFVFPELDLMLSVQPFKQEGKPHQIKPQVTEQPKQQEKPKGKLTILRNCRHAVKRKSTCVTT